MIGREVFIPDETLWEAIICRGCGRRLYDDDGKMIKSWRRWIGC